MVKTGLFQWRVQGGGGVNGVRGRAPENDEISSLQWPTVKLLDNFLTASYYLHLPAFRLDY